MGWVAAGIAVSGVAGAAIGSSAASDAAQTQADATSAAADKTAAQFAQTQKNLTPYMQAGAGALPSLLSLTGTQSGGDPLSAPLTKPFTPGDLTQTPGYKFTLDQGLKATQNSFASQGLASSGAALKGAANYAEGLAGTTYQQQFGNYLTQNRQIYDMINNVTNLGENAAAGVGQFGANATSAENALTTSGAAARAAGTVGGANAITAGLGTINSAGTLYGLSQGNGGIFGSNLGGANASNYAANSGTYAEAGFGGANPLLIPGAFQ